MQAPNSSHAATRTSPGAFRFVVLLAGIFTLWIGFGLHAERGFVLALGTNHEPSYDALALAIVMSALGLPATYLIVRLLLPLFRNGVSGLRQTLTQGNSRATLAALCVVGTFMALLVRHAVLDGAPLTDDESAYRLQAELLASGRLWAHSHKMPVFFDNGFMLNDGKLYGQYFLGWPLLYSLGFLIKLPSLINPLLSGLTAVLMVLIAERRFGVVWGRVAALLYLCSPFMMVSAATVMSHTSSSFALTLLLYAVDRSAAGDPRKWLAVLVAFSACLAFWIRPATGLGMGTPLVLAWMFALRHQGWKQALLNIGIFVLTAATPALLFLFANEELTGSMWKTGYHAAVHFEENNRYRFASFRPNQVDNDKFFYFFTHVEPELILTKYAFVLNRLWTDSWGFPIGFGLAFLATKQGLRFLLAPIVGMMVAHIPLPDAGIDTFGPVHFTELMIPLTLASTDGLRRLYQVGVRLDLPGLAPALFGASVLTSLIFYDVPRFTTLALLAADIRSPSLAFESAPPQSVVFVRKPFAPTCLAKPASHFVFSRPNNDPDFQNERLWANHIDLQTDRKLLAAMPGWRGFLLRHDPISCHTQLVDIDKAPEALFPPSTYLMPGDLGEVPRPR
jgi:hypothetical protein